MIKIIRWVSNLPYK